MISKSELQHVSIANANGLKFSVINFGARVISLHVPDKNGRLDDVVLGFGTIEQYLNYDSYYGAIIGRYANRIANGKFSLNEKIYQLPINNGLNSLHGGHKGFHNVLWKIISSNDYSVSLSYFSRDGEEGFPGNLDVKVTYTLTDGNELTIEYEATTDEMTIVNLTHHSFFNLAGEGNGDVLDHELMINADRFCAVNDQLIPTGELKKVNDTVFDFLTLHKIGERINQKNEQLKFGNGYDHNWVLNKDKDELSLAAKVKESSSGRMMEVWTTERGLQFYSGNFLNGKEIGKGNKPYLFRSAFCLEAQHFPDSPNQKKFPSTILKPGEIYKQKTVYRFSII